MKILLLVMVLVGSAFADCKLINKQCLDSTATKVIGGITYSLADACSANGLTGVDCCWDVQEQMLCTDGADTCGSYRQNSNCVLLKNTCIEKDYVTGNCEQYQSTYTCAGGYVDVESRVCTNVVCANNESGTAQKCFNPIPPNPGNTKNMGNAIAFINMGQSMAQDMQCSNLNDPTSCSLFSGKYFSCYMYAATGQLDGWHNNGADCMIHHDFFNKASVPTGYALSDRSLYSQATGGSNNVMGNPLSFGLSSEDSRAINNSNSLRLDGNTQVVNPDENVHYDGNHSRSSSIGVQNGQVTSVTINKDMLAHVGGLTDFNKYLSDQSVNLAWNRQKAEPDPSNVKNISFADEGISRGSSGDIFGWHDSPNQPVINGLCVHFADYCDGGDNDGTASDAVRTELSWAGIENPNFCAKCTSSPLGVCLAGEPKSVLQQWCCFSSKVALDINLAAYDQGLLDFYYGGDKYSEKMQHNGGICGGVTVGMISKIDFSKGNYFNDLMNSIDINQLIDTSNFTDSGVQGNTQNRVNGDATNMVNQWKQKNVR